MLPISASLVRSSIKLPFRRLAIIGMLLPLPACAAHADKDALPEPAQRYRVLDSEAALVVRRHPDPSAERSGTLDVGANDIVVAGTRLEAHDRVWWQVIHEQELGWVEAGYLAPMDADVPLQKTFPLRCVGTEPFWSLHVEDDESVFETPESSQRWTAGPVNLAVGMIGRYAVRLEDGENVGHLAAWRNPHFCSDSMSNIGYPFEGIVVVPDGTAYSGCCMRAGEQ